MLEQAAAQHAIPPSPGGARGPGPSLPVLQGGLFPPLSWHCTPWAGDEAGGHVREAPGGDFPPCPAQAPPVWGQGRAVANIPEQHLPPELSGPDSSSGVCFLWAPCSSGAPARQEPFSSSPSPCRSPAGFSAAVPSRPLSQHPALAAPLLLSTDKLAARTGTHSSNPVSVSTPGAAGNPCHIFSVAPSFPTQ